MVLARFDVRSVLVGSHRFRGHELQIAHPIYLALDPALGWLVVFRPQRGNERYDLTAIQPPLVPVLRDGVFTAFDASDDVCSPL